MSAIHHTLPLEPKHRKFSHLYILQIDLNRFSMLNITLTGGTVLGSWMLAGRFRFETRLTVFPVFRYPVNVTGTG